MDPRCPWQAAAVDGRWMAKYGQAPAALDLRWKYGTTERAGVHNTLRASTDCQPFVSRDVKKWLRGRDLNPRPLGYEPNELPDCSTPRQDHFKFEMQDLKSKPGGPG